MKKLKQYIKILSIFIIAGTFFGCDDTVTNTDIDKIDIPATNVSYGQHIEPVLRLKCANAGCHDDQTRARGIAFTTWISTTADKSVIFPGQPENSTLIFSIQRRSGFVAMPPLGYTPLTQSQLTGIYTWVKEGAKNN